MRELSLPIYSSGRAYKVLKALRLYLHDYDNDQKMYECERITRLVFDAAINSDATGQVKLASESYRFHTVMHQGRAAVSRALNELIFKFKIEKAQWNACNRQVLLTVHEDDTAKPDVSVTVRDLRFLYEFFYNQAFFRKHFTEAEINEYVGVAYNPFLTKAIEALKEKIKALDQKLNDEYARLSVERDKAYDIIRQQIAKEKAEINGKIGQYIALASNPAQPVQAN